MSKITFKKFLAALLSVVMVLTILPINIPTSATTNDYYYDIFDGAVEIYEYCGEDTTVNIPSTIEGYPVVTIGDSAFYYNTNIKGVIIPDSVKRIGVHAFAGCIELSSVTFGEGVTTIEDYAFYNCASLIHQICL